MKNSVYEHGVLRRVRDEEESLQVQGGGADVGLVGLRIGGAGGVAGGGSRLSIPSLEGSSDYGAPLPRGPPQGLSLFAHLNIPATPLLSPENSCIRLCSVLI